MRGYLVVGPESSCSQAVTRLLLAAGCGREPGKEGYPSELLAHPVYDGTQPLVVHRSFPYAEEWPYIPDVLQAMTDLGAPCSHVLVCFRSSQPMEHSQVARGFVPDLGNARDRIHEAYTRIFCSLSDQGGAVEVLGVSADAMFHHRGAARHLLEELGLADAGFAFTDADRKWWA